MKKPYYYLLLIVFAGLAACSKKPVPEPTPEPVPEVKPQDGMSAVSGMILPVFAANSFTLTFTNTETNRAFSTKPDAKGQYKLTALPPGKYEFSVQIEQTSLPPMTLPLTLMAGKAELMNFNYEGHAAIPLVKGTGKITGSISPAGQGASAVAYHSETRQQYLAEVDASGAILIKDLPAGSYSVSVNRGSGYTAMTTTGFLVTLAAGESKSLNPVQFSNNADPASPNFISYELDGKQNYRKSKVGAEYDNTKFHLYTYSEGYQHSMTIVRNLVVVDRLDLMLDDVKGIGTYVCKGTAQSNLKVSQRNPTGMGYSSYTMIWTASGAGASATISITAIDPVNRTISGSFTATLVPENALAKGNKTIAKGSFANYKY